MNIDIVAKETIRKAMCDIEGEMPEWFDWAGLAEDCLIAAAKEARGGILSSLDLYKSSKNDSSHQRKIYRQLQAVNISLLWIDKYEDNKISHKERGKAVEVLWKHRDCWRL
jgi:hypothetical protein